MLTPTAPRSITASTARCTSAGVVAAAGLEVDGDGHVDRASVIASASGQHLVEREQLGVPHAVIEGDAEARRADGRGAGGGEDDAPTWHPTRWRAGAGGRRRGARGTGSRVRVGRAFGHAVEHKTSSAACQSRWPCATVPTMTAAPREPTGRRTQAERRTATRTKLLDAAVECLIDRGYAATSVVDVQQRAGVSRGALQHYWPSRAALVVDAVKALFDSMAARLRADMAAHAARVADADPAAAHPVGDRAAVVELRQLALPRRARAVGRRPPRRRAAAARRRPRPPAGHRDRRSCAATCSDRTWPPIPRFAEAIGLLTQCMRGAALVVDLHPKRRPQLVPEWHRQTCLALEVAVDPVA